MCVYTRRLGLNLTHLDHRIMPANFVVTHAGDSGAGSLRQAIQDSNANPGNDLVTFDGMYFTVPRVIALTSGELLVNDAVDIIGPGAELLTISGNNASRVFHFGDGFDATLSGLTVADGKTAGDGGGVYVGTANLTAQDCVFRGNRAAYSGAIFSLSPLGLNLINCRVVDNSAMTYIGGVYASGGATVIRSTIAGNEAGFDIGGLGVANTLLLRDSTVSGNSCSGIGGGVWIINGAGPFVVHNSTVSGNTSGSGGGIALGYGPMTMFNAQLRVVNSTITNNAATHGGGLALYFGQGSIALESSLVAGNAAVLAGAPDIFSNATVTLLSSAIGSDLGFNASDLGGNLPFGIDLKLGPLVNNGGPTATHLPLPGSPLLGAGSNPDSLTTDQRGYIRDAGGIDIDSVERQNPPKVTAVVVNAGEAQRSRVTTVAVTFDQPVTLPADPSTAFKLTRQDDGASVTLHTSVAGSVVTLAFSGAATENNSLADGRYTLSAFANAIAGEDGPLDGDADGKAGGNYVLVGTPANGLFRLFGDFDGDAGVYATDFAAFRLNYGTFGPSPFDFDNDGQVGLSDFTAFRFRFGVTI